MADLDEELEAQAELHRQQEEERQKRQQAAGIARQYAARQIKARGAQLAGRAGRAGARLAATGARAAAVAIGDALVAAAPVIGIILLILGIVFFVLIVLTALCNSSGWQGSLARGGSTFVSPIIGQDYCKVLQGGLGGVVNFIDQGRVPSIPNRFADVSQWDALIREAAAANNLPYCYVRSFVEKESGGNAKAIGHDHTAPPPPISRWQSVSDGRKASEPNNTHDPFNLGSPPKHTLDWEFSHGIGLMQITIFPRTHQLGRAGWVDDNTPAREMPPGSGKKLKVLDLLDPKVSIDAATKYLAQLVKEYNGDYQAAAAAYNGSGAVARVYGDQIIDRTNLCLRA